MEIVRNYEEEMKTARFNSMKALVTRLVNKGVITEGVAQGILSEMD